MHIVISILQVAIGLWYITGSVYMMGNYAYIASFWAYNTLPGPFWISLGVVQIILSIGLIISVKSSFRTYAAPSAIGLAVISLAGTALYASYTGLSGMLWALIPAVLLAFIAYKRRERESDSTPAV